MEPSDDALSDEEFFSKHLVPRGGWPGGRSLSDAESTEIKSWLKGLSMYNGQRVRVLEHGETEWEVGTVIKARKQWVRLDLNGHIADESSIAEWEPDFSALHAELKKDIGPGC